MGEERQGRDFLIQLMGNRHVRIENLFFLCYSYRMLKNETRNKRRLHKDWRTWLVIVLMLAAIGIYVLTLDDSIQPTGRTGSKDGASTAPSKP
jgi:hypothetical protein